MLEPVEPPKVKKSRNRRPEHIANTLFVNASESNDVFAPVKKKTVKVKQAKDYAGFVAEVGDDEIDPYAIPSYGSTRLTHGDEELVEELASQPDRAPRGRRKNAPIPFADETEEKQASNVKKGAPKRPQEQPKPKSGKGKANAPVPSQTPASDENFAEMKRKTQEALDAVARNSGEKSGKKSGASTVDALANAIKTLVGVNINLLELISGFMADKSDEKKTAGAPQPSAPQRDAGSTKKDETVEKSEASEAKKTSGRRQRRGEQETTDASASVPSAPKKNANEESESQNRRAPRDERRRNQVEKDAEIDAYDPFAFWESIEDDELPAEPDPASGKRGGSRARGRVEDVDSDSDDAVEIGAKKKTGAERTDRNVVEDRKTDRRRRRR